MIGERLIRARKAAGLSLRDLASEVGVSHTWINRIEKDEAMPDSAVLLKLGKALGVRSEYFFRPRRVHLSQPSYRKQSGLPKKRLHAITHDILDQIERRMELEAIFPHPPMEPFRAPEGLLDNVRDYDQVEEFADQVRREWDLGLDPIPGLVDLFEMRGVRVFRIDARQDAKFDGLFAYVDGSPVVVVGQYWPGDRQRFTLAHELGHLLLAERLPEGLDMEKACHRFAGAFLFPASAVRQYLGEKRSSLELREIQHLKHEFGLSMAAIIRRAFDLSVIKESVYKSLTILFSQKGWRKHEPGEQIAPEEGAVFTNLVFHALAENYIGESKAAELLGLPLDQFHRYRSMEDIDAAPCQ